MDKLNNAIGGAVTSSALTPNPKKNIQVREVDNGFIVEMGYGQIAKVAKDKEEVLQFISEFLG